MGHGKETPRQKMIGMMYLVLTAMLALNVSKSVLDAFVLIDDGLMKTIDSFVEKNQTSYMIFDAELEKSGEKKVGPFRDKALDVKIMADKLTFDIQELKVEIVELTDGKTSAALTPIDWMIGHDPADPRTETLKTQRVTAVDIQGKDNKDIPGQVMMVQGEGSKLKVKFDEYREALINVIKEAERGERDDWDESKMSGEAVK